MKEPWPTRSAIRKRWAATLVLCNRAADHADAVSADWCFACGHCPGDDVEWTERAHITARADGGSNDVDNLHLLCPTCHKASESLAGGAYWEWFAERTLMHMLVEWAARHRGGAALVDALGMS